jgi:CBS domain-containing protein
MAIADYCRRELVTIDQNETIQSAAMLMESRGVGCVLVTGGGRPWGILTDRDLALRTIRGGIDARKAFVSSVTERDLITIREDRPVRIATRLMERFGVRRLPVVNRKHEVIGIVAWDDLLGLVAHELDEVASGALAQAPRLPIPASRALAEITGEGASQ